MKLRSLLKNRKWDYGLSIQAEFICIKFAVKFQFHRIIDEPLINSTDGFALHKISVHWYILIGFIVVWIPGVIISYLTGGKDFNDVNFQLLAPCVRRFIPKRYRHTKLKVITVAGAVASEKYNY